jgi:hypothetical protein
MTNPISRVNMCMECRPSVAPWSSAEPRLDCPFAVTVEPLNVPEHLCCLTSLSDPSIPKRRGKREAGPIEFHDEHV